jgi:ribonuclease P protein component
MPEFRFRKKERILKRSEFQNVLNQGEKRRVNSICTIFWIGNEFGWRRLGIIASKKIGNAPARNKAKRKIREVFRLNKSKFKPALDIVVISGKGAVDLPFSILENKISRILQA